MLIHKLIPALHYICRRWKSKLSVGAFAVCPGGDAAVPVRRHRRDTEEKVDWVSRAAGG